MRVINVISLWVQKYSEYFLRDANLKKSLDNFIVEIKQILSTTQSNQTHLSMQNLCDRVQKLSTSNISTKNFTVSGIASSPSIPRNDNFETLQLQELDDEEV